MRFCLYLGLGGLFLVGQMLLPRSASAEADYMVERIRFIQARQLLRQGKIDEFRQQLDALDDYPLQHYLIYAGLRHRLQAGEQGLDITTGRFCQKLVRSQLAIR